MNNNNRLHNNKKYNENNQRNERQKSDDSEKYLKYFSAVILKITSLKDEYDDYIDKCKEYAEYLKKGRLTTSQIRKIYSDIMNAETAMDLKRLRPRLAYITGKNEKNYAIRSLISILDEGIKNLEVNGNEEEKKSLKEFIETIVAYRKYYGDDK
ncbi:type III-A CRISPR-associated protein Csm2 [Clostridium felsineum]|uniref:CRISPR system Cms protein Csm2 n=1 Tax=Clostridium felsineum TaxID=36839 RepID=A0A1S8LSI4_9CLOT|nr:type III-A CRISPR-associated protein Csm2 [Clostridium felsineum]URZ02307.1 hypothetical protein CLAUR_023040 [Clostridium felsineum]URZ04938.1 hypothetical protein CLROS_002620 [Clostridium felsineum]URZ09979.1 hypothetical protein CROST_006870 [Clostridium felsineum]